MKIMILEDDNSIRKELSTLLAGAGYETEFITHYNQPVEAILKAGGDLLLLDITLPGLSGEEILRLLRKKSDLPVIMVTSRTSDADEVLSMSYGADDYVTKPYNPTILLLRIEAVLKRVKGDNRGLSYRGCPVDPARGTIVSADGSREIILTKNEMLIFETLLGRQGQIVLRDELMTRLWDCEEYLSDNALTVNVSRLRGKLSALFEGDVIETRKKQGYVLL